MKYKSFNNKKLHKIIVQEKLSKAKNEKNTISQYSNKNENKINLNFKSDPLLTTNSMKNIDNIGILNERNKKIIKNQETNLCEIKENEENLLD